MELKDVTRPEPETLIIFGRIVQLGSITKTSPVLKLTYWRCGRSFRCLGMKTSLFGLSSVDPLSNAVSDAKISEVMVDFGNV